MRIAFDAKRAFRNYTGLGNYSRFILSALKHHFPEEEYLYFSPGIGQNPECQQFYKKNRLETITPSGLWHLPLLKSAWRMLKPIGESSILGTNIFHGLSNELPLGKADNMLKVVTIHDLIFLRYPKLYSSIDRKIYLAKTRHSCQEADHIIAISTQTRQDLIDLLRVPAWKISVIYQGIHPIFYQHVSTNTIAKVRSDYGLPEKYLLSVGTIEERKNTLLILQAIVKGKLDKHLVLVGKKTAYQTRIEAYAKSNGISQKLLILNQARFTDFPAMYHGAELFIYPSRFEGFGIPILEAMACGTPVLAANRSSLPEAGGDAARYFHPDRPDELAELIKKLGENREEKERMRIAGKKRLESVSPARIAGQYMQLYRTLHYAHTSP